ncbi:hypothetical protein KNE206_12440 [Kitasatospora sp. NE20-6]|uniref:hypothetical protein n=1 Tax=Kitasatospora sp. NE20-6 TaxID=2859066 RepID=UPI0034DC19E9
MSARTLRTSARRALRTGAVLALLLGTAAGASLSTGTGPGPVPAAAAGTASPQIPVDPVTGAPVPIDGPAAAPAAGPAAAPAPAGTQARRDLGRAPGAARLAPAATGAATAADPVTVTGSGDFAGLEVTVGQTGHLVNQVVAVTWTGGRPTEPSPMVFARNYLEIMQCWGDEETGPDRSQCQYGATKGDSRGGAFVPSRQLNYGRTLIDPAETVRPAKENENAYVPFRPATGDPAETGGSSQYFDIQSTNEVPFAPTRADGTGQVYFEVQTGSQAPGLGCGQTPQGRTGPFTEGRRCWLVIVPRGDKEVDGQAPSGQSGQLQSSPLSATNWQQRLVVPLHFEPVGISCPIGSPERPTLGTELAEEMIARWQPVLCQQAGGIFSFTRLTDDRARARLQDGDPGLVYVGAPLAPAEQTPGRDPVYAPVAVSGLTIAFDIESQSYSRTPPEVRQRDGERITDLSLTPRLVAKLLTQSYRFAANPGDPDIPADNPADLTSDPEFLAINPQFKDLYFPSRIPDLLLPSGEGDGPLLVWRWLFADPDARDFLAGRPSPTWHDSVNKRYLTTPVTAPKSNYSKVDDYCLAFPDDETGRPPWCNFDSHPFANSMSEGARAAARGDTLAKSVWDATTTPGSLRKAPPQAQGLRGVLVLTTTALADRYGLDTAKLRNTAGEFVAPGTASLLAAAAAATPGAVAGVPVVDPAARTAGAYPLTSVTYAATVPAALDRASGAAYASLLRYAVGDGQTPGVAAGRLPAGYARLPDALRRQTLAAADRIAAGAGAATPAPTGSGTRSTAGPAGARGPGGSGGTGSSDTGPAAPAPVHSPVTLAPAADAAPAARTGRTEVGPLRHVLVAVLVAGLAAAAAGAYVPRVLRRRIRP